MYPTETYCVLCGRSLAPWDRDMLCERCDKRQPTDEPPPGPEESREWWEEQDEEIKHQDFPEHWRTDPYFER